MSKKLFLSVLMTALLVTLVSGFVMADYTPLPGVLSPDEVDFGGKTVKLFTSVSFSGLGFEEGDEKHGRIEKAEKLFNVNISKGKDTEKISLDLILKRVMSGDATHDIYVFPSRYGIFGALAQGVFYPVGKILPEEYYESLNSVNRSAAEAFSFNGTKYVFGSFHTWKAKWVGMRYNKTMLERENLPDIWDLYEQGEWTWDQMEELMRAVTKDTDGDGKIDQWGMSSDIVNNISMFYSNEAPFIVSENGNKIFNWNSPEAIETFAKLQKWYEDGLIKEGFLRGGDNILLEGGYDAWPGKYPEDVKIGLAPLPKGPSATQQSLPVWDTMNHYIPVNAENPESLIALVEFLWRPDDKFSGGSGKRMDTIKTYFPAKSAARFLTWASQKKFTEDLVMSTAFRGTNLDISNLFGKMSNIIYEGASAKSTMDEMAPEVQSKLDELFEQ